MKISISNLKIISGIILAIVLVSLFSLQIITNNTNANQQKGYEEVFYSITDNQQNIILYGTTTSIDFPFTKNITSIDIDQPVIFLMKYSSSGNLLWSIRYIATVNSGLTSLTVDKNDSIIITGIYQEQNTINFFVSKFSPDGNLLFRTNISNADAYKQLDVLVSSSNEIYLFGKSSVRFTYSNGLFAQYYSERQFLSKIDSNGTILWTHSYKPANVEKALLDNNNNLIYSEYETVVDSKSLTHYYLYVNKISSNGTFLWHKFVNEVGIGRYSNMAIDSKNNIIITGLTLSNNFTLMNTTKLTNINEDGFTYITKLNRNGVKLWDTIPIMCYPAGSIPSLFITGNNEILMKGAFNTTKYIVAPTIYHVSYLPNGSIMTVNGTVEPIAISPYEIIFNHIIMNQDGSYYTIGVTSRSSDLLVGKTIKGPTDILVLKFSSTDSFEWGSYVGGY